MLEIAKCITWLFSPLALGLLGFVLAFTLALRGRARAGRGVLWVTLAWFWLWSSAGVYRLLGGAMERDFPPRPVAEVPAGDVIVVLGGGMAAPRGAAIYPEMYAAADRVWHAARLYHAGKAPLIVPSGYGERNAAVVLLRDLGVPAAAIRVENASYNTSGNARLTAALLRERGARRVILVTSAFHMRRALLLFRQAGIEAIPAATDHEALLSRALGLRSLSRDLLPNPEMLNRNTYLVKEVLGYWTYRLRAAVPHRVKRRRPAAAPVPTAPVHSSE